MGTSGSGKSTAAQLIPRFYDASEGRILVGGVDVRQISKQDLMRRIAFVFQTTKPFKDTLLENIRAARQDATREEVLHAAEAAQCKEIIDRLPMALIPWLAAAAPIFPAARTSALRWQGPF